MAQHGAGPARDLGTHGHGPVGAVLLGSATRGILRRAEVPVVVVRRGGAS
jgi:nucleotide-binding universal stress UspA family protein